MKQSTPKRDWTRSAIAAAVAQLLAVSSVSSATPSSALPKDLTVVNGQATVSQQGNSLTVTNSNGAILDWRSFSIGSDAAVHFQQAGQSSKVLNRVTGSDPSNIFGKLTSNGQVWLLNPNGVLFGQGAKVDVHRLVVSTSQVSNQQFADGNLVQLAGDSQASVVNQGALQAGTGGILIAARQITNDGTVVAHGGDAQLIGATHLDILDLATPRITIRTPILDGSVTNRSVIQSLGGQIDLAAAYVNQQGVVRAGDSERGGQVRLNGLNAVALASESHTSTDGAVGGSVRISSNGRQDIQGKISARGEQGKGGDVTIEAGDISLANTADIDVSGQTSGGHIFVGGGLQGQDASIANARTVTIEPTARLSADALREGNGGRITIWSDQSTRALGQFSAVGAGLSGEGGWIETSGGWLDARPSSLKLAGANGKNGTWLIDPYTLLITDTPGAGAAAPGFSASAESQIASATINSALESGVSVVVTAAPGADGLGNILIRDANLGSPTTPYMLQFKATGELKMERATIIAPSTGASHVTLIGNSEGQASATQGFEMLSSQIKLDGSGSSLTVGNRNAVPFNPLSSGPARIQDSNIDVNGGITLGASQSVSISNSTIRAAGQLHLEGTSTQISSSSLTGGRLFNWLLGNLSLTTTSLTGTDADLAIDIQAESISSDSASKVATPGGYGLIEVRNHGATNASGLNFDYSVFGLRLGDIYFNRSPIPLAGVGLAFRETVASLGGGAPSLTVRKTFDGATAIPLSQDNMVVSGLLPGHRPDFQPTQGQLSSAEIGTSIPVSLSYINSGVVDEQGRPVLGYAPWAATAQVLAAQWPDVARAQNSAEAMALNTTIPATGPYTLPAEGRTLDAVTGLTGSDGNISYGALPLSQMSPQAQEATLAARSAFKADATAPALQALQVDPMIAKLGACKSAQDIEGGECLITDELKQAAAKAQLAEIQSVLEKWRAVGSKRTLQAAIPQIERKLALVIGVSHYHESKLNLEGAAKDADAVARRLRELGYDVVHVEDPDRSTIVRHLNQLALKARSQDSVLLYFAGHGKIDKAGQGYWIPADGKLGDPSRWLSNQDISEATKLMSAKQLMMVADSCFSGAFVADGEVGYLAGDETALDNVLSKRAAIVLSSGGEEPVKDVGKNGHSPFTWHFMAELERVSKWTSGTDIYKAVAKAVRDEQFVQSPRYGTSKAAAHERGAEFVIERRELEP